MHNSLFKTACLCLCFAGVLALASGCTEPLTLYHVPGSEAYLAQGRKILILPFMDTRTYVGKDDEDRSDIGDYTRNIFVEALREFHADQVVEIMTPKMPRRTRSLTNAQVAELGRQHGADLVVAGQVFSFTGTRAASIPPRAGMFLRIINAQDASLLFAGDHYRAAGIPGAEGGRDLQALYVSARLIEGFLSSIRPALMTAGDIASAGALAMLSPQPAKKGLLARLFSRKERRPEPPKRKLLAWTTPRTPRLPIGNLMSGELDRGSANREQEGDREQNGQDGRKRREPGNVPETERYLGMTASFLFSPDKWDEQFVPEVPPLIDFEQDFYQLPAPPVAEPEPESKPLPPVEEGEEADASSEKKDAASSEIEVEVNVEAEAASDVADGEAETVEPSAPPMIAETAAEAAETPSVAEQGSAEATAPADSPQVSREPGAEVAAAESAGLPEASPASETMSEAASEQVARIEQPVHYYEEVVVDPTAALVVAELPEIDISRVYPNMVPADAPYPPPAPSAKISGDELGADLFASGGDVWGLAPKIDAPEATGDLLAGSALDASPFDFTMSMTPETPVLLSSPDALIVPYAAGPDDPEAFAESAAGSFELDPETLEIIPRTRREARPAPRPAATVPALTPDVFTVPPMPERPSPRRVDGVNGVNGGNVDKFGGRVGHVGGETVRNPALPAEPVGEIAGVSMAQAKPKTQAKNSARNRRRTTRNQSVKGMMVPRRPVEELGVPAEAPIFNAPIVSVQPRTYKTVDNELSADPYAVMQDQMALVAMPGFGRPDGVKVLILPYHERDNPNNLIYNTGGGEVVTTLFATQLASDPGIRVMWDGSGQATHHRLLTREEAVQMGRAAGADFVLRGQVVEFRRAQSVPSFYSAVISTAMLAAQFFFAEMSGVDVATEVYRVADGMCVMSRRDRSQQKYVVQAEKTVRRMAGEMGRDVASVIRQPWPEPMDPLIDNISPVTVAADPNRN